MYNSTHYLTSALDGVGGQRSGRFTPEKDPDPLFRRLGGLQGQDGRVRILAPTGIRSPDRPVRSESPHRLFYYGQQFLLGREANFLCVLA
jgi:hypothetical protein